MSRVRDSSTCGAASGVRPADSIAFGATGMAANGVFVAEGAGCLVRVAGAVDVAH
jgi:hypothetical protein